MGRAAAPVGGGRARGKDEGGGAFPGTLGLTALTGGAAGGGADGRGGGWLEPGGGGACRGNGGETCRSGAPCGRRGGGDDGAAAATGAGGGGGTATVRAGPAGAGSSTT